MHSLPSISLCLEENQVDFLYIIQCYLESGLTINNDGIISYVDVGDIDTFDWKSMDINEVEKLYSVIKKKIQNRENPGVFLLIPPERVGFSLTYVINENTLSFLLTYNNKRLSFTEYWTDVSWYLGKILKPLDNYGIRYYSIQFYESYY